MTGGEYARTRELLDRMPPVEHAPILEKLGSLGFQKFRDEYAIDTPVDKETGIVDHDALVASVKGLVGDDYRWKAPFFDEHHTHWYGRLYDEHAENPSVAGRFRNLPVHKLWVPRQFHEFTHLVTIPPKVPEVEAMRHAIKDFRRRQYLYTIATSAIEMRERTERMLRVESPSEVLYIDPVTRRATRDDDSYEARRRNFVRYIERHHRRGLIDLSELSPMELRDTADIESILPEIRQFAAAGLMRAQGVRARRIDLPIDKAA